VTEKAGGRGFEEIEGFEKGDKAEIGEFTGLLQSVHRLVDAEEEVRPTRRVSLKERNKGKTKEDCRREKMSVDFNVLGGGEVSA
jgi:hypothetical protein